MPKCMWATLYYSCAFAKRRRFSGVCQAYDTRLRFEFSLNKQASRAATQRLLDIFDDSPQTLMSVIERLIN